MTHHRSLAQLGRVPVVLLVVGCSGTPKPAEPERLWNTADEETPSEAPDSTTNEPQGPFSVEKTCERFRTLRNEGCDWTQRFPANFSETDTCETSLATWVDPATPNHESLERTLRCWSLDCEAAIPCIASAQKYREADPARECGDEGTAPVFVDDETWHARVGQLAKRFADVSTSVDKPVEVCGIEGEVEWMLGVTCNDGSNPYGSMAEVNDGRDGWLDRGGRCNSVLDRYTVSCPEATYTIHIDRYLCQRPH